MKLAFPVATPETADPHMLTMRGDLEECFELLARLGYHGTELMVRDPGSLDPERIRTLAANYGLGIAAVSTSQIQKEDGLTLSDLDATVRKQAVERLQAVIDWTAALGVRQVNLAMVRGKLPAGDRQAAAVDASVDSLNQLLDYALERRMGLAIEPINRKSINWLNTVEETLAWIDQFPQPNLSLLFDLYHALMEEQSINASLIRAFPRVSHVQVADSNRRAPGWGQLHFGEFLRVLRALGYRDYISVEAIMHPDAQQTATMAARHLLPFLEEAT